MINYQLVTQTHNLSIQTTAAKPFACQLNVMHIRQEAGIFYEF